MPCLGISVLGDGVGVFRGGSHGCLHARCLAELYIQTKPPYQVGVGSPHCGAANTGLVDPLKLSSFFSHRWFATALLAEERRGDLQDAAF